MNLKMQYKDLIKKFENKKKYNIYSISNSTTTFYFKNELQMKSRTAIFLLKIFTISIIFTFFSYQIFTWLKPYISLMPITFYLDPIKQKFYPRHQANFYSASNETLLKLDHTNSNSTLVTTPTNTFNKSNNNSRKAVQPFSNELMFDTYKNNKLYSAESEFERDVNNYLDEKLKNYFKLNDVREWNVKEDNLLKFDEFRIEATLFEKIVRASMNIKKNRKFIRIMLKTNKNFNIFYRHKIKHKSLIRSFALNKKIIFKNLKKNFSKLAIPSIPLNYKRSFIWS